MTFNKLVADTENLIKRKLELSEIRLLKIGYRQREINELERRNANLKKQIDEDQGGRIMAYEPGELKVFNPNKEISKEITLEILIRHRDALKQARTGEIFLNNTERQQPIKPDERKLNQIRGLNLVISAQREMITFSRPVLFFRATQAWKKKFKEDKEQEDNPFNEQDNDYSKALSWLNFLSKCASAIVEAEKSKTLEDDFLLKKEGTDGQYYELTKNFYEMMEDLESSYEQIYLLMLTNKIVSAGIEEDEELSYKEKEKEAINRVLEA